MSERFQNSVDLFGQGFGMSTTGEITCDLCGTVYNQGICAGDDDDEDSEGGLVTFTEFAGMTVCYCCYGIIEAELLGRLDALLPWVARVLAARQVTLTTQADSLRRIISQIPTNQV